MFENFIQMKDDHMAETFTPLENEVSADVALKRSAEFFKNESCSRAAAKAIGPGPILGPRNEHAVPPGFIPQHEPGAKMDSEKPRANLVLGGFANALLAVSTVGTMGAKKYTDNGWKVVPDGESRYREALLRHFLEEAAGQAYDPESQLLHIAHTAWNALAILELKLKEMKLEHWHE